MSSGCDGGLFSPAYMTSRVVGMASGYIVTGLIACPGILLDWFLHHLKQSFAETPPSEEEIEFELCVYDIPYMFMHEQKKAHVITTGGFFTQYPLGTVSEVVGSTVNTLVSAATFVAAGLLVTAAAFCGTVLAVMLMGIAALFSGIYCLTRCCRVGPEQTCIETLETVRECL